jgi:hypothetical protein
MPVLGHCYTGAPNAAVNHRICPHKDREAAAASASAAAAGSTWATVRRTLEPGSEKERVGVGGAGVAGLGAEEAGLGSAAGSAAARGGGLSCSRVQI